jgi:hypothetical protein
MHVSIQVFVTVLPYFVHLFELPLQLLKIIGCAILQLLVFILGIQGEKVNIQGGHSLDYSKKIVYMYVCPILSDFHFPIYFSAQFQNC